MYRETWAGNLLNKYPVGNVYTQNLERAIYSINCPFRNIKHVQMIKNMHDPSSSFPLYHGRFSCELFNHYKEFGSYTPIRNQTWVSDVISALSLSYGDSVVIAQQDLLGILQWALLICWMWWWFCSRLRCWSWHWCLSQCWDWMGSGWVNFEIVEWIW